MKNTEGAMVHQSSAKEPIRRTNSAFLIMAYTVVCEGYTAKQAYLPFAKIEESFITFRDASACPSFFQLNIYDCLEALEGAIKMGWFQYDNFDCEFYEHYEKVGS